MKLTPQSQELTDFVLGELPEEQRTQVESRLAQSEELRGEVHRLRALTGQLESGFEQEPEMKLSPARRGKVLNRASPRWTAGWGIRFRKCWDGSLGQKWFAGLWGPGLLTGISIIALLTTSYLAITYSIPQRVNSAKTLSSVVHREMSESEQALATIHSPTPGTGGHGASQRIEPMMMKRYSLPYEVHSSNSVLASASPTEPGLRTEADAGKSSSSTPLGRSHPPSPSPVAELASDSFFKSNAARPAPAPIVSNADHEVSAGLKQITPPPPLLPLNLRVENPPPLVQVEALGDSSYRLARARLLEGLRPRPEFVRIEEWINYFSYEDLESPEIDRRDKGDVRIRMELAVCPWNPSHVLLRVSLQVGARIATENAKTRVTLAVSGASDLSLNDSNSVPGENAAFGFGVAAELAGSNGTTNSAITGRMVTNSHKIPESVPNLEDQLQSIFLRTKDAPAVGEGGPLMVQTTTNALAGLSLSNSWVDIIEKGRSRGMALDVIALGVQPESLPNLAQWAAVGGGSMESADTSAEGRRALRRLGLNRGNVVADEIILELHWSTNQFAQWRSLGEFRQPAATSPTGVGLVTRKLFETLREPSAPSPTALPSPASVRQGTQFTQIYELVPSIFNFEFNRVQADTSKIGGIRTNPGEVEVKVTLVSATTGDTNRVVSSKIVGIARPFDEASGDFKFATAVAGFGLLLREAEDHAGLAWNIVETMAKAGVEPDPDGTRHEFLDLIQRAKDLK